MIFQCHDYHQNKINLEKIVEKASHKVAEIYRMQDRNYNKRSLLC